MNANRSTFIIICLVYQHISFFLDRLQYEILVSRIADFFLSTNEIDLNMGLYIYLLGTNICPPKGERFFIVEEGEFFLILEGRDLSPK